MRAKARGKIIQVHVVRFSQFKLFSLLHSETPAPPTLCPQSHLVVKRSNEAAPSPTFHSPKAVLPRAGGSPKAVLPRVGGSPKAVLPRAGGSPKAVLQTAGGSPLEAVPILGDNRNSRKTAERRRSVSQKVLIL